MKDKLLPVQNYTMTLASTQFRDNCSLSNPTYVFWTVLHFVWLYITLLLRKDVKRLGKMAINMIFEQMLSQHFMQQIVSPPKPLISEKEAYRQPDALNIN